MASTVLYRGNIFRFSKAIIVERDTRETFAKTSRLHSQQFSGGSAFVRRNGHLDFLSFTPGPSPFSGVKMTPAASRARWSLAGVSRRIALRSPVLRSGDESSPKCRLEQNQVAHANRQSGAGHSTLSSAPGPSSNLLTRVSTLWHVYSVDGFDSKINGGRQCRMTPFWQALLLCPNPAASSSSRGFAGALLATLKGVALAGEIVVDDEILALAAEVVRLNTPFRTAIQEKSVSSPSRRSFKGSYTPPRLGLVDGKSLRFQPASRALPPRSKIEAQADAEADVVFRRMMAIALHDAGGRAAKVPRVPHPCWAPGLAG